MEKLIQTLNQINWDFSDYNSLKFPLDINSIPWYPATLPPPIPKFLIALLTKENDIVFDPFGGKGTAVIEAIKQNRRFCYNDLNPYAVDITTEIVNIIKSCYIDEMQLSNILKTDIAILQNNKMHFYSECEEVYEGKNKEIILQYYDSKLLEEIKMLGLSEELIYWYHYNTLKELIQIYKLIGNVRNIAYYMRKFAFSSILKEVCSQRGHFTYITDNCRPYKIIYYNAFSAYTSMLERIKCSAEEFKKQFKVTNNAGNMLDIISKSNINCGDARKLKWIENNSIDFVITSPPYLCAQDYIKTMRLINLFFPDERFNDLPNKEIGARARRRGKAVEVVRSFYNDMDDVLGEIRRVLKKNKYFCLVIGQGKGKITEGYDTVKDIYNLAVKKHNFKKVYHTTRNINYKAVRVGGVDREEIIIFQKIN